MSLTAVMLFFAPVAATASGAPVGPAEAPAAEATASAVATKEQLDGQVKDHFKALDADRNGRVDRAEAERFHNAAQTALRNSAFSKIDADGNGTISREEFAVAMAKSGPKESWFDANDIDRNGKVEINEALAKAQRGFERADADSDGKLTAEELRAHRTRPRRR